MWGYVHVLEENIICPVQFLHRKVFWCNWPNALNKKYIKHETTYNVAQISTSLCNRAILFKIIILVLKSDYSKLNNSNVSSNKV